MLQSRISYRALHRPMSSLSLLFLFFDALRVYFNFVFFFFFFIIILMFRVKGLVNTKKRKITEFDREQKKEKDKIRKKEKEKTLSYINYLPHHHYQILKKGMKIKRWWCNGIDSFIHPHHPTIKELLWFHRNHNILIDLNFRIFW